MPPRERDGRAVRSTGEAAGPGARLLANAFWQRDIRLVMHCRSTLSRHTALVASRHSVVSI